ncbi:hypothetical protein GCM10025772_10130 [Ferrimonas gelatinilytica]|uniref:Uncharacterized protein n=1 Tax=Ferrimonas gelatinilytica TaxID=1255257 RepID=A0ABP9RZA7_9GAMM
MIANRNARPNVRGTNRKWYIAVSANCNLDRSTTSSIIIAFSSTPAGLHDPAGNALLKTGDGPGPTHKWKSVAVSHQSGQERAGGITNRRGLSSRADSEGYIHTFLTLNTNALSAY